VAVSASRLVYSKLSNDFGQSVNADIESKLIGVELHCFHCRVA